MSSALPNDELARFLAAIWWERHSQVGVDGSAPPGTEPLPPRSAAPPRRLPVVALEQLCEGPAARVAASWRARRERAVLLLLSRRRRCVRLLARVRATQRRRRRLLGPVWRSAAPWRCQRSACRLHLDVAPGCALAAVERNLDGMTLEAVGDAIGVTRERVRQIETRALAHRDVREAIGQVGSVARGVPELEAAVVRDASAPDAPPVDDDRIRRVLARGLPPRVVAWFLSVSLERVRAVAPEAMVERRRAGSPRRTA